MSDNKKKLSNKKKVLIIIGSFLAVIIIAFAIFPLQIINFILAMFYDDVNPTEPDSYASLFTSVDTYIENPIPLSGGEITPITLSDYNFNDNVSTSIDDAVAMFLLAENNLKSMNQWGLFIDVLAEETYVVMGKVEGKGSVATQIIKIQDEDNFFLNEGFALVTFEFLTTGNTQSLSNLLMNEVNGGCRILVDTDDGMKYLQWVPKNGASYDPETKLISTALLDMSGHEIQPGVKDKEPYDRDKTFESLLPVDISADTLTSVEITYDPEAKIYTINAVMNPQGMTNSTKSVGTIQNLFGEGLASEIEFNSCNFVIEIWDNGLIKSIEGMQDWSAKLNLLTGLNTHSTATATNFYFTYHQDDCAIDNIKNKYYDGLLVNVAE